LNGSFCEMFCGHDAKDVLDAGQLQGFEKNGVAGFDAPR